MTSFRARITLAAAVPALLLLGPLARAEDEVLDPEYAALDAPATDGSGTSDQPMAAQDPGPAEFADATPDATLMDIIPPQIPIILPTDYDTVSFGPAEWTYLKEEARQMADTFQKITTSPAGKVTITTVTTTANMMAEAGWVLTGMAMPLVLGGTYLWFYTTSDEEIQRAIDDYWANMQMPNQQ
jgi:hypothetical protein